MEIKIGNCELKVEDPKNPIAYYRLTERITKGLFTVSGMDSYDKHITAFSQNLQSFLVENKDFVIGIVNAGKIKINEVLK